MNATPKLLVSRWVFDAAIGQHRDPDTHYEFFQQASEALEIRKIPQHGGDVDTVYIDFSGDLSGALAFSKMYEVNRKSIVLARDWRKVEGLRARLKPVNLDYDWSLLNWNHEIHIRARHLVYRHEDLFGTA